MSEQERPEGTVTVNGVTFPVFNVTYSMDGIPLTLEGKPIKFEKPPQVWRLRNGRMVREDKL